MNPQYPSAQHPYGHAGNNMMYPPQQGQMQDGNEPLLNYMGELENYKKISGSKQIDSMREDSGNSSRMGNKGKPRSPNKFSGHK